MSAPSTMLLRGVDLHATAEAYVEAVNAYLEADASGSPNVDELGLELSERLMALNRAKHYWRKAANKFEPGVYA